MGRLLRKQEGKKMDENTLRSFDKKLMDTVAKDVYMDRILAKIFGGIAILSSLCQYDELFSESRAGAAAASIVLAGFIMGKILMDNQRYLYVKSGNVNTSVYYVLRTVPCDKKLYIRNRMKRLVKTHGLFTLLAFAIKLLQQLIFGGQGIGIFVLFLMEIGVIPFIFGTLLVLQSTSYKWSDR